MIYGMLSQFNVYTNIPYHDAMVSFMKSHDLLELPVGDYDILGKDLYLRVLQYFPSPAAERKFETHRLYGDVHIILRGIETIATVRADFMTSISAYDAKKDIQFFTAEKEVMDVILGEQQFAVFFAGESHKPQCLYQKVDVPIRKFVFKMKMG